MQAFIRLGSVDVALRVIGFQRLVEHISQVPANQQVGSAELWRAAWYAHWLERASHYHFARARCLHRSLALHQWLHQQRLPSELRIGVRKEEGVLKAHAWVELGGHVVNEPPSSVAAFTPLATACGQSAGWNEGSAEAVARAPLRNRGLKVQWQ